MENSTLRNQPDQADELVIPAAKGDVLVLASDGFFDNVFDTETLQVLEDELNASNSNTHSPIQDQLARSAKRLLSLARQYAEGEAWSSRYGGKWDDITIIVATIVESSFQPP
jgi:protein phosphatase PTC7